MPISSGHKLVFSISFRFCLFLFNSKYSLDTILRLFLRLAVGLCVCARQSFSVVEPQTVTQHKIDCIHFSFNRRWFEMITERFIWCFFSLLLFSYSILSESLSKLPPINLRRIKLKPKNSNKSKQTRIRRLLRRHHRHWSHHFSLIYQHTDTHASHSRTHVDAMTVERLPVSVHQSSRVFCFIALFVVVFFIEIVSILLCSCHRITADDSNDATKIKINLSLCNCRAFRYDMMPSAQLRIVFSHT